MWIAVLECSFKVETFCYLTFSNSWRTWRGCLDAGEPSFYPFHWMLSFPNRPNTFTRHYLQGECQWKKRCWRWFFCLFSFHFHGSLTSASNWLFWPLMPLTCLRFCFLHLLCYLKTTWNDLLLEFLHSGTLSVISFFTLLCPSSYRGMSPEIMWF